MDTVNRMSEEINRLREQVGDVSINNVTNNSTNVGRDVNIQNNYYLRGFGNEDISNISFDDLEKIARTKKNAVPNLNKLLRSNPENMNLYMNNVRDDSMKVYNGESWETMNKIIVLDELAMNTINQLQDLINKFKTELSSQDYNNINTLLENGSNDDEDSVQIALRHEFLINKHEYIKKMKYDLINMRKSIKESYEKGTGQRLTIRGG